MGGLCVHFRMILRKSGVNDTLWMCFLLTILSSALLTKSMGDRPVGDLSLRGVELETTSCEEIREADGSVTLHQAAFGGIGLNIHNIRARGSYIRGTNGTSNGLVPMLRVFNDTARYVDQGGGKRKVPVATAAAQRMHSC
jgi:hypothetical protein